MVLLMMYEENDGGDKRGNASGAVKLKANHSLLFGQGIHRVLHWEYPVLFPRHTDNVLQDHINRNNQFIKGSTSSSSSCGHNHQVSSRHIKSS